MADEQDKLNVSLEPPKLFGRKKKGNKQQSSQPPTDQPEPAPRSDEPVADEPVTDEPEPAQTVTHEAVPDEAGAATTSQLPAAPAADEDPISAEIDTGLDDEDDLGSTATASTAAAPTTAKRSGSVAEKFRGGFTKVRRAATPRPAAQPAATATTQPQDPAGDGPGHDEQSQGHGRGYTAPMLAPYPAAVLTGGIVGLTMVILTWLSLRGCEAIRGTASCGGGPGFLLLLAMFIVAVMLGSAILKSFDVPDPGSSSFLAVGLVAVVALLLLINVLGHWSMLLVIPVVAIGAYTLSVFITKTFVEAEG